MGAIKIGYVENRKKKHKAISSRYSIVRYSTEEEGSKRKMKVTADLGTRDVGTRD
jgi:hypothetical protein